MTERFEQPDYDAPPPTVDMRPPAGFMLDGPPLVLDDEWVNAATIREPSPTIEPTENES